MADTIRCPHCGRVIAASASISTEKEHSCPECGKHVDAPAAEAPVVVATVAGGPSAATKLIVILAIVLSALAIAIYGLLLYGAVSLLFKRMAKARLPAAKEWVLWELIASAFIVLVLFAIGGNVLFDRQPTLKPSPGMAPAVLIAVCAVFYVAYSFFESVFAVVQLGHYRRVHFAGNENAARCLIKSVFLGFFLTNFVLLVIPLAIVLASAFRP